MRKLADYFWSGTQVVWDVNVLPAWLSPCQAIIDHIVTRCSTYELVVCVEHAHLGIIERKAGVTYILAKRIGALEQRFRVPLARSFR